MFLFEVCSIPFCQGHRKQYRVEKQVILRTFTLFSSLVKPFLQMQQSKSQLLGKHQSFSPSTKLEQYFQLRIWQASYADQQEFIAENTCSWSLPSALEKRQIHLSVIRFWGQWTVFFSGLCQHLQDHK